MKPHTQLSNIEIIDLNINNQGIAKIENQVVFVNKTIPGDIVTIEILKKKKGVLLAKPIHFEKKSDKRVEAKCQHFGDCGGCKIQNMSYPEQLKLKEKFVFDSLKRIAKLDNFVMEPILGSEKDFFYRNKLEFSFSNRKWLTTEEIGNSDEITNRNALGFHIPGRFDRILDIEECLLQDDISNKIRNAIREFALKKEYTFFDPIKNEGFLRNMVVRTSTTNDIMLNMVFGTPQRDAINEVMSFLTDEFPEITSFYFTINTKMNDALYDLNPVFYTGKAHIKEKIDNVEILLGPKSFYQTNSYQAIELYNVIKNFGTFNGTETLYDLYSGVGSIGLFLSKYVSKVIGIETVQDAVYDAQINTQHNEIGNAKFYCGIVEEMLDEVFVSENGFPDVVVIDPPRSGLHPKVIQTLIEVLPEKIIYVSCNPATQARDIVLLNKNYTVEKIQPVDMFPHTLHVENVVLLRKI